MRSTLAIMMAALVGVGCGPAVCKSDRECTGGQVCGFNARCGSAATEGAPCLRDEQCQGQVCQMTAGAGVCVVACDGAVSCPVAARCQLVLGASRLRFACQAAGGDHFAGEPCVADDQCTTGLCHDGHCTSACGVCPSLTSCHPTTLTREAQSLNHGVCTWWPTLPVLEAGERAVTAEGPASHELDIPQGVMAFTMVLEDFDGHVPVVLRLVGPDGTVFISGPPGDAGAGDFARCSTSPGLATVLVPGTDDPRGAVKPGRYRLELGLFDGSGFPVKQRAVAGTIERVAAVIKPRLRSGLIDLTMHLAPETQMRTADGGVSAFITGTVNRLDELLRAKAGLAVRQVEFRDLPRDAGIVVDTVAQARALLTAHSVASQTTRAINVMLVRRLGFASGLSGNSPGAPGVYGRSGSGVIIEPLGTGPEPTGVLLTHEVLHFLGLSHTSDFFYGPDLITDTPSCASPSTSCPDGRNLMFPSFYTREPLELSAGQVQVLQGSPWPSQPLHPGACGAAEVVGLTDVGFAAGTTSGAPSVLEGSCGGSGPERVFLIRLEGAPTALEVEASGLPTGAAVYVRQADCVAGPELGCAVPDGGTLATLSLPSPPAGAYFVVVDGVGDGGSFRLKTRVTE